VSFVEAVQSVFRQYASFSGRARRSEFWWFQLFGTLVSVVGALLTASLHSSVPQLVIGLALLLPSLAVTARRLHDTSRSAWWLLIYLVPVIGAVTILVFMLLDSHGDNAYGPSPKDSGTFHTDHATAYGTQA
jgi:uncharacterized membrane protein YhaH (DUF805 family)